jgi:hypothetical protein
VNAWSVSTDGCTRFTETTTRTKKSSLLNLYL